MKWFIKQESFLTILGIYTLVGIIALLVWWAIYQAVLARRYSVRNAVFGDEPNPAVALDLLGGMLASGILVFFLLRNPSHRDFWINTWTIIKSLGALLLLMAVLRIVLDGILRIWFGSTKDAQGDVVTLNNELFKQRNLATGIFSSCLYLILVAGLLEIEVTYSYRNQVAGVLNMFGVWLIGGVLVVLHSVLFLGFGPRNHILHECFHDNNPAATSSLLGLVGGYLLLTHHILSKFAPGKHIFNTGEMWLKVGGMLIMVLVVRSIFQALVYLTTQINLSRELVIRDNVAWGMLDGGLILILCLILISFL